MNTLIIIVFDKQFNLLNKSANLDLIYIINSFNFVVVITIIYVVTILITLNPLSVNVIAIRIALALRACFTRIFQLINTTNLFVVGTSFCTSLCVILVDVVLRDRFLVVAITIVFLS